jgi:hypothetical protein
MRLTERERRNPAARIHSSAKNTEGSEKHQLPPEGGLSIMAVKRITVVLSFSCLVFAISQPTSAAGTKKKPTKSDPALPTVEKVLRAEVAGQVDRRGQLAETLKHHADSATARWQGGFVKDGDTWRSFDESPRDSTLTGLLADYRRRREETPRSFDGQMDLANWCRKQGLKDPEHVHLLVAVSLAPQEIQPALLERLGYVKIGAQWLSSEQQRDWQEAIRQTETSLKKFSSKIERIAERLAGSKTQRAAAIAELRAAADPSAIPAIELILAGRDEETAQVVVETFAKIEGPEASLALARQGVFCPWPAVRKGASAALRERRFEDFVPSLITLLVRPAEGSFRVLTDPRQGALVYSYVVATETENQFQVATFNMISPVITRGIQTRGDEDILLGTDGVAVSQISARDALNVQNYQRERLNDRIEELNSRVIGVLAVLSDAEPTPDVHKWWQWWYDFNDTQTADAKSIVRVSEETTTGPPIIEYRTRECFAAGTPVWTESGAQAIETIKIGDRVLAKDVETGELAYKPVLQTTIRPPKELTTLRFGDETIICTGGHRFWSSGTGWVKARDLEPQTLLHTITGNTPVWSARKGSTAETHNLVVADFHTYFVGKTGVLCQDLLIPKGTSRDVPGLARK